MNFYTVRCREIIERTVAYNVEAVDGPEAIIKVKDGEWEDQDVEENEIIVQDNFYTDEVKR